MLHPESPCQPFFWKFIIFTTMSQVIVIKVFFWGRILFPLAHGLVGLLVLLELHGNYSDPWLDG
jgi:hypothetical protein